jgi:hypothetical protein
LLDLAVPAIAVENRRHLAGTYRRWVKYDPGAVWTSMKITQAIGPSERETVCATPDCGDTQSKNSAAGATARKDADLDLAPLTAG